MLAPDKQPHDPHGVTTMEALEALYGGVARASIAKEADRITDNYRKLIEAAPFFALATVGEEGLDCSPRGDPAGFVRVLDAHTLAVPDRRGNNRIDSLRNIVRDPRCALLFLIPGVGETLRINGAATITTDPALCESFVHAGKTPVSCIVVTVESVFFQCSKAIVRSKLWDPAALVERTSLPSAGDILAEITRGELGGAAHDAGAEERVKQTIY